MMTFYSDWVTLFVNQITLMLISRDNSTSAAFTKVSEQACAMLRDGILTSTPAERRTCLVREVRPVVVDQLSGLTCHWFQPDEVFMELKPWSWRNRLVLSG